MFCVKKDAREASQVRLFYLINTIQLTLKMRNVNGDILSWNHATDPFEMQKKMSCFLVVKRTYFLPMLRYHFYSLAYYFSSYCLGLELWASVYKLGGKLSSKKLIEIEGKMHMFENVYILSMRCPWFFEHKTGNVAYEFCSWLSMGPWTSLQVLKDTEFLGSRKFVDWKRLWVWVPEHC